MSACERAARDPGDRLEQYERNATMSAVQEGTGTVGTVHHFDAKMDGGFKGKPVIGLITLSTDCITEHELRLMTPADRIVISATRIKTQNPLSVAILREHVGEI